MKVTKVEDMFALSWAKKMKAIEILGGKCSKCGCSDEVTLDFHHKKKKNDAIRDLKTGRWSIFLDEVRLCVLLCSNCHKEHHCKRSRNAKAKEDLLIDIKMTKCSKCEYSGENFASLEFHHKNPSEKLFCINEATCRKKAISLQELNEELNKCILLCSNCHRKHHFDYEKFNKLKSLIYKKIEMHKEIRPKIDRNMVLNKMINGYRQTDIVKELGCSKGTISDIVKKLKKEGKL